MIEKEFIPYQEAFEFKKLGFNEECFWWYGFEKYLRKDRIGTSTNYSYFLENNSCSAPTYSQAFRWFRDNHGLYNQIHKGYGWEGIIRNSVNGDIEWNDGTYNSPEEAELACLKQLIEIVKNK